MIKLKSYLLFSLAAIMAALGFNNAALASQKSLNVESPAGEPLKFETECDPQLLAVIQLTKISNCTIRIIVDYMGYCGMSIKSAIPLSLFFNTPPNVMQDDWFTMRDDRNEYLYNPVGIFAISSDQALIAYNNPVDHYTQAYIVNPIKGTILKKCQLNGVNQVLYTGDRFVNGAHETVDITEAYLLRPRACYSPHPGSCYPFHTVNCYGGSYPIRSFKVSPKESAQHCLSNLYIVNDLNNDEKTRVKFGVYERILAADSIGNGEIVMIVKCVGDRCDNHVPMLVTYAKSVYPKQDQENVLDQSRCYIMPDLLKSLRPACGNYYTYAQRVLAATSFGLGCWSVWNAYRNTASLRKVGVTAFGALASGFAACKMLYRAR